MVLFTIIFILYRLVTLKMAMLRKFKELKPLEQFQASEERVFFSRKEDREAGTWVWVWRLWVPQ